MDAICFAFKGGVMFRSTRYGNVLI